VLTNLRGTTTAAWRCAPEGEGLVGVDCGSFALESSCLEAVARGSRPDSWRSLMPAPGHHRPLPTGRS